MADCTSVPLRWLIAAHAHMPGWTSGRYICAHTAPSFTDLYNKPHNNQCLCRCVLPLFYDSWFWCNFFSGYMILQHRSFLLFSETVEFLEAMCFRLSVSVGLFFFCYIVNTLFIAFQPTPPPHYFHRRSGVIRRSWWWVDFRVEDNRRWSDFFPKHNFSTTVNQPPTLSWVRVCNVY